MSDFKLQKDAVVEPQLELQIATLRKVMSPEDVVEHVIALYGSELEKANAAIATLKHLLDVQKKANDELFRIKQKVVIVNRELMLKIADLEKRR